MGHIRTNPLLDTNRGIIYVNQRTNDSNNDGIIDNKDDITLWRIALHTKTAQKLQSPFSPIALNSHGDLLIGTPHYLQIILLHTSKPIALPNPPNAIRRAWFDRKDRLHILTKEAEQYILQKNKFIPHQGRTDQSGKSIRSFNNKHFPLKNKKRQWVPLFQIRDGILFLLRVHPNPIIIAAKMARKEWQLIYKLPSNATKFFISRDRKKIIYLTTWDTDRDGNLIPEGLDKSAISYIRLTSQ